MAESFDSGPRVARSYSLAGGNRVRLRLAQPRDLAAILDLFRAHAEGPLDLEVSRILQDDPREQIAICATALVGQHETIVGFGTIEVGSERPDAVVVDQTLTEGLEQLISEALASRSATIAERRAA